jgi:glycerophosphoryl diester phosphodiesterase
MNWFIQKYYSNCILSIFIILLAYSCTVQDDWFVEVPTFDDNSQLINTTPLTDQTKYALEGIYLVSKGGGLFGDTLVLKQTRDKISLFGYKNAVYAILGNGSSGNDIILEGYWRCAVNDKTGLIRFRLSNSTEILQGDSTLNNIILTGVYSGGASNPDEQIELRLWEKFTPKLRADPFVIGAHRGGGRTSDRLPVSENSVAMINYTEYLGSTGIEIDVMLTKDEIPVLYHDYDLNLRLVQKGPLYGRVQDYKLSQLRTLVKLIHGENIPTLEEAFDAVLENTNLSTVWLDVKDAASLEKIIPLQEKYMNKAEKQGRKLTILTGIPSDDIYNKLITINNYQNIPTLCELSTDKVTSINAKAWAFRWTMGLQEGEVIKMHNQGRKCLVWTLDEPGFMKIYATNGGSDNSKRFDGILTNYPSLLAYYHYVHHNF